MQGKHRDQEKALETYKKIRCNTRKIILQMKQKHLGKMLEAQVQHNETVSRNQEKVICLTSRDFSGTITGTLYPF